MDLFIFFVNGHLGCFLKYCVFWCCDISVPKCFQLYFLTCSVEFHDYFYTVLDSNGTNMIKPLDIYIYGIYMCKFGLYISDLIFLHLSTHSHHTSFTPKILHFFNYQHKTYLIVQIKYHAANTCDFMKIVQHITE